MEIIEVPSYTEEEKLQIAKRHLLKKQLIENGLKPANVKVNEAALRFIIEAYTREAGVRTLVPYAGQAGAQDGRDDAGKGCQTGEHHARRQPGSIWARSATCAINPTNCP